MHVGGFINPFFKNNKEEQTEKRGGKAKTGNKKKQSRDRSRKNSFPVGNYGLRRAERWEYIPTVSSEVIEI